MNTTLPKAYDPKNVEDKLSKIWKESLIGGTTIQRMPTFRPAQTSVKIWSPMIAVFSGGTPSAWMARRINFFKGFFPFGYIGIPIF